MNGPPPTNAKLPERLADWSHWIRSGIAAEGRERRITWIVVAVVLVFVPVAFNLARSADFVARADLAQQEPAGIPPQGDPEYFRLALGDRVLRQRMNQEYDATFLEYRDAAVVRQGDRLVVAVRSGSADRAQELANGLAQELVASNLRFVQFYAARRVVALDAMLRADRRAGATRLARFKERRALRRLLSEDTAQIRVVGQAERPEVTRPADKVADALPGPMPGRASPFWAGVAGLLLFAVLWVAAFVISPPPGYVRSRREPGPIRWPGASPDRPAPQRVDDPVEPLALPWWGRAAWIAALAATPLLTLFLIARHGVNMPFFDEWTNVVLFQAHDFGTLGFSDFWRQHNEHRPVFPKAADFLTGILTRWDLRVEMYRNFVVAVATFGLLLMALRRTLDRFGFILAAVVTSVVFFSPTQWENWLWGWELEWFLSNLGVVGAVWALTYTIDRSPRRGLVLAALCGILATFSLGSGLLVWPVGVALLVLRRRPWRAWSVVSVLVYAAYFNGWENYKNPGSKTLFLERPLDYVDFVTLYFGRAFAINDPTGNLVGLVMIAAFLAATGYVVRNRHDRRLLDRSSVWIGLGLYSLGSGLLTGISRVIIPAAVSRYSTVAVLLVISTLALLLVVAREEQVLSRPITPRLRRRFQVLVASLILVAALVNLRSGIDATERYHDRLDRLAACSRNLTVSTPPCLKELSPYKETTDWIVYLRSKGWAGYR